MYSVSFSDGYFPVLSSFFFFKENPCCRWQIKMNKYSLLTQSHLLTLFDPLSSSLLIALLIITALLHCSRDALHTYEWLCRIKWSHNRQAILIANTHPAVFKPHLFYFTAQSVLHLAVLGLMCPYRSTTSIFPSHAYNIDRLCPVGIDITC